MDNDTRLKIHKLLSKQSRYSYLLQCGMDDLELGIHDRRYRLAKSEKGVVFASRLYETNIFYSVGDIELDDLKWILSFEGQGELYFEPHHLELVSQMNHPRMGKISRVRFYWMDGIPTVSLHPHCRQATPKDIPEIQKLADDYYPGSVFDTKMLRFPFIGLWEGETLLATAGVTFLNQKRLVCQIGNFLTHPDYRGRGLGKAAGNHLLYRLKQKGILQVRLEVYERNHAACALYESMGFKLEKFVLESLISK